MRRFLICLFIIFGTTFTGWSQEVADVLEQLRNEGFEDLKVCLTADTIFLQMEDHSYRGTFRGVALAIQTIAKEKPEIEQFEVLLTDYRQPQLCVHASKRGGIWDVSVDRQMRQMLRMLQMEKVTAPSAGKIDITLFPMVSLTNNKLDHLFDWSVHLAPAFATTLWKGARLTLQPVFPIAHRLSDTDSKRRIQIGNANLSQQFVSSKHWKVAAAAGFFHPERVGVQATVGYHLATGLDIYADGGITYEANNGPEHGFGFVRDSRQVNAMLRADYYEPHTKLQIELQGGQFLFGDHGGRLDVTRHFGEYAIGVYGILTGGEQNAGFHFAIPFGPKRQRRNAFVRLRLPEYFAWEYSMKSYFKYWEEQMGQTYVTQPDQNHAAHYWEPMFVQEYITRILNGTFD